MNKPINIIRLTHVHAFLFMLSWKKKLISPQMNRITAPAIIPMLITKTKMARIESNVKDNNHPPSSASPNPKRENMIVFIAK